MASPRKPTARAGAVAQYFQRRRDKRWTFRVPDKPGRYTHAREIVDHDEGWSTEAEVVKAIKAAGYRHDVEIDEPT